ncbi:hypothetical protein MHYP_G00296850 [Metynnis hypsauchen]
MGVAPQGYLVEVKLQCCTMWGDEAAEIKVCQNECVDIALIQPDTRLHSPQPPFLCQAGPVWPDPARGLGVKLDK